MASSLTAGVFNLQPHCASSTGNGAYCDAELNISAATASYWPRSINQSINQSINARFVGRRYTTRPGAPT